MENLTLLVLAAGLGNRYGGAKQVDTFGPGGETLMEYSIYDAIQAGFAKIVFVVRQENLQQFQNLFHAKLSKRAEVDYAIQSPHEPQAIIPKSIQRTKPWGTGHAILSAASKINSAFAVVNADDYYGHLAFKKIAGFLTTNTLASDYAFVAYPLKNTLSAFGTVSRGCCTVDAQHCLVEINECTNIQRLESGKIISSETAAHAINENTLVSMNLWGFKPSVFNELRKGFAEFINSSANTLSDEFYITTPVQQVIAEKKAKVHVLPHDENWFGVTYARDKEQVKNAIGKLIAANIYPEQLWK